MGSGACLLGLPSLPECAEEFSMFSLAIRSHVSGVGRQVTAFGKRRGAIEEEGWKGVHELIAEFGESRSERVRGTARRDVVAGSDRGSQVRCLVHCTCGALSLTLRRYPHGPVPLRGLV